VMICRPVGPSGTRPAALSVFMIGSFD